MQRDDVVKWGIAAALTLYGLYFGGQAYVWPAMAIAVAALDLSELLLWGIFVL